MDSVKPHLSTIGRKSGNPARLFMFTPRSITTLNGGMQIFGGTIVLFYVVEDKVFVAADSRIHSSADAPLQNDGCK
jgi:hypothetical protein